MYEASRFDEALPYARQVVELSERGEDPDYELPIAYNNLGATQYQLGDYVGAGDSYRKSLDLLEATQGISSRRLVVPLAGLGAVYAAREEHLTAAELFERALAVSRRADGLFNLQQVPLVKQAADSRYAIGDFAGAESYYLYALKIAEQNYGYGDPRSVPPLLELGTFYEGLREFIAARTAYLRARDAAITANPGYSPEAVRALTGISRSHRLQFMLDPISLDSPRATREEVTEDILGVVRQETRVLSLDTDRNGLKPVQQALDLLRSTSDPPPELLTLTLIELGDWHQTSSRTAMSMPYYIEAAAILDARSAADTRLSHPLREPRIVFYRPPLGSNRKFSNPSGRIVAHKAVFSFQVTETGLPQDITVVSTDVKKDQLESLQRAISQAIYSPRFADGAPVSTAGVTFTGEWREQYADEKPPPAPAEVKGEQSPATEPDATAGT
jgi:tetratricopeptide (TPR) repeat protein